MFHAKSSCERSVCFHHDVVSLTEGRDLDSGVERVNLDLIDCGKDPWFGSQELLHLRISEMLHLRTEKITSYMLHSEIADTSSLDLAIVNSIFNCSPTFQPPGLASVWAMKQEKVDVS